MVVSYGKIGRILLWLSVVIWLCSCGGPKSEYQPTVTLEFWHTHTAEETETLKQMIQRFEQINPKIKVNLTHLNFWEAYDIYMAARKKGELPDIMRVEITWLPSMVEAGYLAPLDDKLNIGDRADFLSAPFHNCQYGGRVWGIPEVTDCLALLYNRNLVPEPPTTFDELINMGQQVTLPQQEQYGFVYPGGNSYWLLPFIWGFGGELITPDGDVLINSPASVQGFQFMLNLRDQYHIVPEQMDYAEAGDEAAMIEGFKNGQFAMIFTGPWATADILTGPEFSDPTNLGISNIPAGPEDEGSPVGGHNYVIAATSEHIDKSYDLIHYLSLPAQQKEFALKNNLLPTRQSTYQDDAVKNNEVLQGFYQQLKVARNRPIIPAAQQLLDELTIQYQLVLLGQKTPREGLDVVARQWESLIAQSERD